MGTITSGVGLISGLDIQTLVDRLMSIEARPRDMLRLRVGELDAQRTAYQDISARISAMLTRISVLGQRSSFLGGTATSSNPDALSASVGESVVPGSYTFMVRALATTQQSVSRGFTSTTAALGPGTISIESARARVNSRTRLEELNGFAGVQRGSFKTVDAAGMEKTINIADAATLSDIVERINNAGNNVRAAIRNDRIVLTETTGGAVRVREIDGGRIAADLGFAADNSYNAAGRLEGTNLMYLSSRTPLSMLNDGNGVRTMRAGGDFTINGVVIDLSTQLQPDTRIERLNHGEGVQIGRIKITTTDAEGEPTITEVDLTGLQTLGQIESVLEESVPGVIMTMTAGKLIVSYAGDNNNRPLKVEDVTGTAARGLGIDSESATGRITGREILFNNTIGDALAAINFASGNDGSIHASIQDGKLVLNAGASVTLDSLNDSSALEDLGFDKDTFAGPVTSRRLLGGIDSVLLASLDGGRGITAGEVRVQVGTASISVSLSGAETLQDAFDRINDAATAAGLPLDLGYDSTGTRLQASSLDGQPVTFADSTGDFATKTGLAQTGPSIRGANLQRQYVSTASTLAQLNNGRGVSLGTIKITNSMGLSRELDLSTSGVRNLGDVIDQINGLDIGVTARINDTGDGVLLEDSAGGTEPLRVTDETGTTARDLNLAGSFTAGRVDGSYEVRIDTAGMSLQDLTNRINAATGAAATASILNDGSGVAPYRLQLNARTSGLAGEFVVDSSVTGMDLTTLTRAQDAQVLLGNNPNSGVLISSSSNTLTGIVPGLNLTLTGTSDEPITVTVNRDIGRVREALAGFVDAYNDAVDRLREFGQYDQETEQAALLFGESTLRTVESRLSRAITGAIVGASGTLTRLSQIGVKLSGGRLTFDEEKFNQAYERDPQAVVDFFTKAEVGLSASLKEQIEAITESDGVIDRRTDTLDRQKEDMNERIEDLNDLLDRKRDRLLRQYQAMERALSQLQSQQAALGQLTALASQTSLFGRR